MPVHRPAQRWLLSLLAVATLFTVMSGVGLSIHAGEFRVVWQRPGLLLRGLLATLVVVPALAIGISRGPTTRTAVATTAATRNAGLALLVATLNASAPTVRAAVLAYIAYLLPIVLFYLAWRRVQARRAPTG